MYRRRFLASVAMASTIAGCSAIESSVLTCAPFDTNADRTVCYDSKSEDEPVWLDVSKPDWAVNPTNDSVETNVFTLHNESDVGISFNPHAVEVHDQMPRGWKEISNHERKSTVTLNPDETYRWVLSYGPHPSPNEENTEYITIDIGGGEYALLIRVPDPRSDGSLACVAVYYMDIVI